MRKRRARYEKAIVEWHLDAGSQVRSASLTIGLHHSSLQLDGGSVYCIGKRVGSTGNSWVLCVHRSVDTLYL